MPGPLGRTGTMLLRLLERRRLRRLFGVAIDHSELDGPLPPPHYREVDFLIVHLREEPAEALAQRVAAVTDSAVSHGAMVESIHSSIVVLSYGALQGDTPRDTRASLVRAILARLPRDASVAHGQRRCLVGSFGSSGRLTFGSQIPGFGQLVKAAVDLDFGRSLEA
jgi:hypothetical protein